MTLKQFNEKLANEYNELVAKGNEDYRFFLNNAYEYAHYNEIVDFFEYLDEEEYNENWRDLIGECTENVLTGVWNSWLNYNHPERFNFFCYEDLIDIIRYYLRHKEEK